MAAVEVNRDLAQKVLGIVDQGLCHGLGGGVAGNVCVEAAVCLAMGLPNSDEPPCVHPAVRAFKINLNDRSWSSKERRAAGMRRVAIAQLGTKDTLDGVEFVKRLSIRTVTTVLPMAIASVLSVLPARYTEHHARLTALQQKAKDVTTLDAARSVAGQIRAAAANAAADAAYAANAAADAAYAAYAAADAAYDAAYDAANTAANAAYDAANTAANAAYAANTAANAAADAADAANTAANAAAAAAKEKARDQGLAFGAELVVEILREMKAPAIEWMDELAPTPAQF